MFPSTLTPSIPATSSVAAAITPPWLQSTLDERQVTSQVPADESSHVFVNPIPASQPLPRNTFDTIGRKQGESLRPATSAVEPVGHVVPSLDLSVPQNKRFHQAVAAGQSGVLRLNMEAIKRQRSEASPALTTPAITSSNSQASKTKFNTIGSSTCSIQLIRKKSGELVKPALRQTVSFRASKQDHPLLTALSSPGISGPLSPSSTPLYRRNSAPSTPVCPKVVHFDAQLEHVKLFLAEQKPAAVSRTGSPTPYSTTEDEWPWYAGGTAAADAKKGTLTLKTVEGLPTRTAANSSLLITNPAADVKFETLTLSEDSKSLKGTVVVKNVAFDKWVAIRFTLDWWQTTSEVTGRYVDSISQSISPAQRISIGEETPTPSHDRFAFVIKLDDVLSRIEDKTMFIALRYNAAGREMWDNNEGKNYQICFERIKPVPVRTSTVLAPSGAITPTTMNGLTLASSPTKDAPSGWAVKHASTPREQMADLRRELEKVMNDDNGVDPRTRRPPLRKDGSKKAKVRASNHSHFKDRLTFNLLDVHFPFILQWIVSLSFAPSSACRACPSLFE